MGNAATAAGRRGILRWQRPTVAAALPVGGVHLNLEAHVPGLRRVSYHLTVLLHRIAMNANGFENDFQGVIRAREEGSDHCDLNCNHQDNSSSGRHISRKRQPEYTMTMSQ